MESLLPALGNVVRQLQTQGRRDILSIEALLNKLTGDNNAGLLLQRLLYWLPKAKHPGGWVYKSAKDWDAECAISAGALKRIHQRRFLESVGIQRELKKANGAPTNHYRLDMSAFIAKLSHFLSIPIETLRSWLAGDTAESTQSIRQNQTDDTAQTTQSTQHEQPNEFGINHPIHSAGTAQSITTLQDISLHHSPTTDRNNNVSSTAPFKEEKNQTSIHNVPSRSDHDARYTNNNNTTADLPEFPGITPNMMLRLVQQHSLNRVRAVIAYARQQTNLHNVAGFVVARVRDNKLGLEHPSEVCSMDDGKRFISGEYADFIRH